jgi:ribose transport system permease protein
MSPGSRKETVSPWEVADSAVEQPTRSVRRVSPRAIVRRAGAVVLTPGVPLLLAFGAMLGYFTNHLPYFMTQINMISILQFSSATFILAAGFTIVVIGGGIDLSIGAGSVLVALVAGFLTLDGLPPAVALFCGILVGVVSGFTNGLLVTRARINPLIATLGMLYVLQAIGYKLTGGLNQQVYDRRFLIMQARWFGQPAPIYVAGGVVVLTWILLRMTKLGSHIYALGGNAEAARQCALNVEHYRLGLYTLGGLYTGLGGIVVASLTGNLAPLAGLGVLFAVCTAAFLGGVSLTGGRGSIVGVLIGVLFIGALNNGLVQSVVNPEISTVIQGALLITAVAIDQRAQGGYR